MNPDKMTHKDYCRYSIYNMYIQIDTLPHDFIYNEMEKCKDEYDFTLLRQTLQTNGDVRKELRKHLPYTTQARVYANEYPHRAMLETSIFAGTAVALFTGNPVTGLFTMIGSNLLYFPVSRFTKWLIK